MTHCLEEPGAAASGPPIALSLALIGLVHALMALVGLPLFGDGAYYFVEIALDGRALVPNLRYSAVLPQLPVLLAATWSDDVTLLRHAFAFGYGLAPWLSLLGCWLAVRRTAPSLLLFPALFFAVNQINFSGVSELLLGLYLVWPFVLLAALHPLSRGGRVYGWLLGALLVFLHPLAFALAWLSALVAAWNAVRLSGSRGRNPRKDWLRLALGLGSMGLVRLLWTLWGLNAYERAHFQGERAMGYLLAATPEQGLLMALVLIQGLLLARMLGAPGERRTGPAVRWMHGAAALSPLLGLVIAVGFLAGDGIKLKAALTFPTGLLLMGLAVVAASAATRIVPRRRAAYWLGSCALTIAVLGLAKSAAWWKATDALREAVAESIQTCIAFDAQQPPALQWPWMRIVDDWAAPMNALAFRQPGPIPLLLPDDGCRVLADTGIAYLTPWFARPATLLEQRFGPLR